MSITLTRVQLQASIVPFLTLMAPNAKFHAAMELTAQRMQYGEVTFTVNLNQGAVDMKSLNVVVRKRIKY